MVRRRFRKYQATNYLPTDFVEKEYLDIVTYYSLRIIIDLGGHKEFIDRYNDLTKQSLSYFLGLEEFALKDSDGYKRSDVMEVLYNRYEEILKKRPSLKNTPLFKNI